LILFRCRRVTICIYKQLIPSKPDPVYPRSGLLGLRQVAGGWLHIVSKTQAPCSSLRWLSRARDPSFHGCKCLPLGDAIFLGRSDLIRCIFPLFPSVRPVNRVGVDCHAASLVTSSHIKIPGIGKSSLPDHFMLSPLHSLFITAVFCANFIILPQLCRSIVITKVVLGKIMDHHEIVRFYASMTLLEFESSR